MTGEPPTALLSVPGLTLRRCALTHRLKRVFNVKEQTPALVAGVFSFRALKPYNSHNTRVLMVRQPVFARYLKNVDVNRSKSRMVRLAALLDIPISINGEVASKRV